MNELILRPLSSRLAAALLLSTIGCAYENPAAPAPAEGAKAGVPARIELSGNPGLGAEGGSGTVTARVFDAFATALGNQTVRFSASLGTLAASQVLTDERGSARTTITGPEGPIQIAAAVGSLETRSVIAIQPTPAAPAASAPPVLLPPTTAPPAPTPSAPTPIYTVTVEAAPPTVLVGGTAALTATATLLNGANPPAGYEWDCDGNGTFDAAIATNVKVCTYGTVATTTTSAVRVNSANATGTGTVTVIVNAAAPLFVSIAAPTPTPVSVNTDTTFKGTVTSSSAIPATLQWEWDEDGDGTPDTFATGSSPNEHKFTYGSTGVKTLRLTVRDQVTGRSTTTSRTVTVQ